MFRFTHNHIAIRGRTWTASDACQLLGYQSKINSIFQRQTAVKEVFYSLDVMFLLPQINFSHIVCSIIAATRQFCYSVLLPQNERLKTADIHVYIWHNRSIRKHLVLPILVKLQGILIAHNICPRDLFPMSFKNIFPSSSSINETWINLICECLLQLLIVSFLLVQIAKY